MRRVNLLSLVVVLAYSVVMAHAVPAAPVPANPGAISVRNARQVHSIKEVPKLVYRIRRGPRRGELTFLELNKVVEVVDPVNLRTLRTIAKNDRPIDFAASPDGKLLTWTERKRRAYTLRDAAGGKTYRIEVGSCSGCAAFSPDSKLLAVGETHIYRNSEGQGYSQLKLFDVSAKLVSTLDSPGPGVLTPVFTPDGKTLAVGNRNYETCLFDVASGKLLHTLDKAMTHEIAFSPDGKTLAAGYVDGTVALWDVATGKLRHSQPSGCKEVYSLDYSPKGDVLVTSGFEGGIVLWDAEKLTKLREFPAPVWTLQVRFTADGTRIVSSSDVNPFEKKDAKVTVWAIDDAAVD